MPDYGNIAVKESREITEKFEILFKDTEILASNMNMLMDRLSTIVAQTPEKDPGVPVSPSSCKVGEMLQDLIGRVSHCNSQFDYLFRNLQI